MLWTVVCIVVWNALNLMLVPSLILPPWDSRFRTACIRVYPTKFYVLLLLGGLRGLGGEGYKGFFWPPVPAKPNILYTIQQGKVC